MPLGKLVVGTNGARDAFSGHRYKDLRSRRSTPRFAFVTPNLCNDGHDATCVGPNVEGTLNASGNNAGGLVAMDLWLEHWMPMILDSPAYRSGKMLVVLTFDESGFYDHFSALRSYEDLLGLTTGGTDVRGHLGLASLPSAVPFGADVFNRKD